MRIRKVVLLGSGGLRIGQAGEFDYSGSQAIKSFKEEGIETVLVNPNIATVQTDEDMADKVYFQPLNVETVQKILERETPDAIALSFGGQTALNLGLELERQGILKQLGIRVLGTPVHVIETTEDRELFKQALAEIGTKTARSATAETVEAALAAAHDLGYPVMMRSGYSLGGLGSGRIDTPAQLKVRAKEVLAAVPQLLIEEYLVGWKEVEYEVVRDHDGNTITVCNMENFDPMGVHTGESIVVAPSQTLTNNEYHMLREVAIRTINHLGIIGECNIQYALHPSSGEYRVIEVNARLSRSSALASKATGYPLAFVASKLMLGKRLYEIKNSVTGKTSAFYEPALDYLAVKMPRWDLQKLKSSDHHIGSEMKSVGEVMALGRSFPEALQKAVRMLNMGAQGLSVHPHDIADPMDEITHPTDRRLFAVYEALKSGTTTAEIHTASHIDPWFLEHVAAIAETEQHIASSALDAQTLRRAKKMGFSDSVIAKLAGKTEAQVRKLRLKHGITPVIKQIDTLAGEFDAETNYLYASYHGTTHDISPLRAKSAIVLGSGPYAIGSSVEFDWSAVNTAKTLQQNAYKTVIVNSNPETVSTDFDRSDRLYFDELTLERVQDIADFEQPKGIVVSVGGQIANNLALPLHAAGYPIFGTSPRNIDRAENRQKFSDMLGQLGIDQPAWTEVSSLSAAKRFAQHVGYPVLIRPSYVLSGGAMSVVRSETEMERYLTAATKLSPDHPTVISQFVQNAKELEIDGVAKSGELVIYAISEHIENAGVHSGDATVVYPAQRLYLETVRRAKLIARQVAKQLDITGPFNIQFIAKDNELKVIECNVRASRSFPFVSKVSGYNFIDIATEAMLGHVHKKIYLTLSLDHVGVKTPQFSYNRMKGADPVAGVEMASTGEVACFGSEVETAFYRSWLATEQNIGGKRLLLSLADEQKHKFVEEAQQLVQNGWQVYATSGTHAFLAEHGIQTHRVHKVQGSAKPNLADLIQNHELDLMVSIPSREETSEHAYTIRRLAIDNHIPLFTNAETGRLLLRCLLEPSLSDLQPKHWREYVSNMQH
ncbi:carbamoyl phosphate synthase large subunit [Candidatus Saccharibacteria bacterium]|nr:MAG: carbamoyl phosphate synthase large subunit [Candidatus Saccharibacteria bacterium]PID98709.1 MAG: carbamoyl phosphate synthase large subunit [Candidatus Saccharibacteria bacterium]